MHKEETEQEEGVGGFQFRHIAGSVTLEARGDIVGGNKTVIQQIRNVYQIRLAVEPLRKAPYKFLAYYDIPDQDIFYGRGAAVQLVSGLVPRHKVVIVNGSSGAGKSSLVNAGLVPTLADNGYSYVRFRDYSDPRQQLKDYFVRQLDLNIGDPSTLTMSRLIRTARAWPGGRIVIVLDQFERYLLAVPEPARLAFANEIKECMETDLTTEEVNIVIAIRQEFLGTLLAEMDEMIPHFSSESHTVHLRSLTMSEARDAIMKPVLKLAQNIHFDRKRLTNPC
jgi:hypothetical protein